MSSETDCIQISGSLAIRWEGVKTLKVMNDKLLIEMQDGTVIEIKGIPRWRVDETFLAYSRFMHHVRHLSASSSAASSRAP